MAKGKCPKKAGVKPTQNNASRIRSMSDEQLKDFLVKSDFCPAHAQKEPCYYSDADNECSECIAKWLQS